MLQEVFLGTRTWGEQADIVGKEIKGTGMVGGGQILEKENP